MTIYFDLDGVLTDFEKKCEEKECFKNNGKPNWDKIDSLGKDFWTEMDWCPGSKALFEVVSDFAKRVGWKIKVLSAIHSPQGKEGKIEWCEKNLDLSKSNIDIVPKKSFKYSRANPLSLLIDDSQEVTNSFIYSGGMAIQYDGRTGSARKIELFLNSIEELEKEGKAEDLNNAAKIMEARLSYLLEKLDFNYPEEYMDSYKKCIQTAKRDFESGFTRNSPGKELWGKEKLKPQFSTLQNLLDESDYSRFEYRQKDDMKCFTWYLFDANPWERTLTKIYLKKKEPFPIFKKKDNIIEQTAKHITQEQKLSSFYALSLAEGVSVLTFVYLNLLVELLQNELATSALNDIIK